LATLTSASAFFSFAATWNVVCWYYGSRSRNNNNHSIVYQYLMDDDVMPVAEYHVALGVFLGFCVACTVTDYIYGMSYGNILVTVVIAIMWACLMVVFSKGSLPSSDKNRTTMTTKARKGTVLPLVMV
jgi:hypothetical protein